MDERQRDEILWRLDERTERMDSRLERVNERVAAQDEKIEQVQSYVDDSVTDLDQRVTRNTTVLAGITFGLSTVVMTVIGKIHAILPFK